MSWTKRQFVDQAFEEIGYASYTFDLEPEQLQAALRRLDSMMATWNSKGIRLSYPLPSSIASSDLDDLTEVPDYAVEAIYLNLAIRIAPSVGKAVPRETKVSAKMAYNEVLNRSTKPIQAKLPNSLPAGAGNKRYGPNANPFITTQEDNILEGPDNEVDFNG